MKYKCIKAHLESLMLNDHTVKAVKEVVCLVVVRVGLGNKEKQRFCSVLQIMSSVKLVNCQNNISAFTDGF